MKTKVLDESVAKLTVHLGEISDDTRKNIVLWLRDTANQLLKHSDKLGKKYTARYYA